MMIGAVSPLSSSLVSAAHAQREAAPAHGAEFSLALEGVERKADATASRALPEKGSQHGTPGALQAFEGFVLRSFVETMLPKENTAFFGSGTAGNIWRSMLAERIGEEIAASGGVGIAELLAKDPTLAPGAREVLAEEEARARAATAKALPSSV